MIVLGTTGFVLSRGDGALHPRTSLAATYIVNCQSGSVQRIGPVTLCPIGGLSRVPGRPGATALAGPR